ncbi:MAG: flagellar hook-length control protein FliK, partial [Boseongicola sp.]
PNPATLNRSKKAPPLRVPSTRPDAAAGQQITNHQPTTTDVTSPPAAPALTSEAPSFAVLPKSVIGPRPQEAGNFFDQALTASGPDGLLRDERAPALDNARRSIPGASRVELARSVAAQIGDAARTLTEGTIEVRLSPEELGRVRMSMIQSEFGLTVTIVAERAETLELIRRNTELFAQDLRNLGHQNISFSFGQGSERQPFDDKTDSPDITTEESETGAEKSRQQLRTSHFGADGRLDIRL